MSPIFRRYGSTARVSSRFAVDCRTAGSAAPSRHAGICVVRSRSDSTRKHGADGLFEETAKESVQARASFNWVSVRSRETQRAGRRSIASGSRRPRWQVDRARREIDISASIAKMVLDENVRYRHTADDIVSAEGLAQIGDEGAILSSVRIVIDGTRIRHPDS